MEQPDGLLFGFETSGLELRCLLIPALTVPVFCLSGTWGLGSDVVTPSACMPRVNLKDNLPK